MGKKITYLVSKRCIQILFYANIRQIVNINSFYLSVYLCIDLSFLQDISDVTDKKFFTKSQSLFSKASATII